MKKTHLILCFLIAVLVCGVTVFAEDPILVNVDYSDHTINVSVQADAAYKYRNISVQVVNPGKNFADLLTGDDVINWSEQGKVKEDGSYSFSYKISGETGIYTVIAGIDGNNTTYKTTFNYFSPAEAQVILREILQYIENKDESGIKSVIETKSDFLQIDTTEFYQLPVDNQKLVIKGILETEIKTMLDFKAEFEKCIDVQNLNLVTDSGSFYDEVKKLAGEKYKAVNTVLEGFESTVKDSIIADMMAKDYKTEEGLINDYAETVLLTKTKRIKIWGEMESFLTTVKDVVSIDFTEYNTLNNKSEAMRKMLDINYTSIKDIKDKFNNAVKETKAAETPAAPGRPGGGGGGSSSGGGGGRGGESYTTGTNMSPALPNVVPDVTPMGSFKDLNEAEWAKESITALYKRNIVSGDGNNCFRPNGSITRAEFLKMIVLTYNFTQKAEVVKNFDDVKKTDWYYEYVLTAYSNGVVSGVSDKQFNPNGLISRQDMAVMLYRAAKNSGKTFESGDMSFTDKNEVSEYARDAVSALSKAGIINGYENKFSPDDVATRAQAAQILYNILYNN